MKVFKHGPVQMKWIQSLWDNPERHMTGQLGKKNVATYQACCLGEGGLLAGTCDWVGIELLSTDGSKIELSGNSFEALGLFDAQGKDSTKKTSLSFLNDSGTSWPEIALLLLAWPEYFFKEEK